MESGQIKENGHASLQLKGHVQVELFLERSFGQGDTPDMFADQAKSAQDAAYCNAGFLSFRAESRVESTDAVNAESLTEPERYL